MIVYVNENYEIKDVGSTEDETLTPLEILDSQNPFEGWSVAKICCYKVNVKEGIVIMMTPYVDSRLIDHIDQLGKQGETNAADITDAQEAIGDTYDQVDTNIADITDLQEAIAEIYELIESEG